MNKTILSLICLSLMLMGCGGSGTKKVDGGLLGDVPSLLITYAQKNDALMTDLKKCDSESEFKKINEKGEKAVQELVQGLDEAITKLQNVQVKTAVEVPDYEISKSPVMTVQKFSKKSCIAVINFTLRATKDLQNTIITPSNIIHTVYFKLLDKDGGVVRKESSNITKTIQGKLTETLPEGTLLQGEISFTPKAKRTGDDGKGEYDVKERKIDQMVIISKDEYDSLKI